MCYNFLSIVHMLFYRVVSIVLILWLTYFGGKSILLVEQLLQCMTACRCAVDLRVSAVGYRLHAHCYLLCRTTSKKTDFELFNSTTYTIYVHLHTRSYTHVFKKRMLIRKILFTGSVHSDRNETKIPWPPWIETHYVFLLSSLDILKVTSRKGRRTYFIISKNLLDTVIF